MTNLEAVYLNDYVKGLGLNVLQVGGPSKTSGLVSLKADDDRRVVVAVMARHDAEKNVAYLVPFERVDAMVPAAKEK